VDPLSCLAHESSSLCSFQRSRLVNSRLAGDRIDERASRVEPRAAPSKLNSAVPTKVSLARSHRLAGDLRGGGRATDAEKRRAYLSHPRLSSKEPGEPRSIRIVCGRHRMSAVAITPGAIQRHGLLRKEVIQPHLPIRLPCYDFVPLT
jgi:hypothetical protein